MENFKTLPEGYEKTLEIDLQKNKKLMLGVNLGALAVTLVMIAAALPFVPIATLFDMSQGIAVYFLRFFALLVGSVVYIILHELVHGIFMKRFSGVKPHYGFTLMYAYAGSSAYFNKKSYIIIALAPVVIWGIVLGVLCATLPESWFWVVYFIQIANLSGAAGDAYVTYKMLTLPKDILVNDTGVAMTVYVKEEKN
ncbi:MAG: DUF3267 domain-containing protein [Clostridia bacterium]|nr:DUF3267 domain-containing protein [Clostridia bacterium]